MPRRAIVVGVALLVVVLGVLFVRSDYFQHEWYHSQVEPRRHKEAELFTKTLVPLVSNGGRFSGVKLFVRARPHRDPLIEFAGVVQSETALRDLRSAVAARPAPFDIKWQVGVTNTPTP
jgi:hypothetical protein